MVRVAVVASKPSGTRAKHAAHDREPGGDVRPDRHGAATRRGEGDGEHAVASASAQPIVGSLVRRNVTKAATASGPVLSRGRSPTPSAVRPRYTVIPTATGAPPDTTAHAAPMIAAVPGRLGPGEVRHPAGRSQHRGRDHRHRARGDARPHRAHAARLRRRCARGAGRQQAASASPSSAGPSSRRATSSCRAIRPRRRSPWSPRRCGRAAT